MDTIAGLATTIASILGPSIPFVVKGGEAAAAELSKKVVGSLWGLLKPKMDATPALATAITGVERHPGDPDYLAALRVQIREVLEADPNLVARVRPLLEDASTSSSVSVIGDRNITAGRDISGSITVNDRPTP